MPDQPQGRFADWLDAQRHKLFHDSGVLKIKAAGLDSSVTNSFVPIGGMIPFYGAVAPTNWLFCDGSSFSSVTYPDLAVQLGGTTLPDLKGKVIVGVDPAQAEFDALGESGGSKTSTSPHTHADTVDAATITDTGTPNSHGGWQDANQGHTHNINHFHIASIGNVIWNGLQNHGHYGRGGYASEGPWEGGAAGSPIPVNIEGIARGTAWPSTTEWAGDQHQTHRHALESHKHNAAHTHSRTAGASSAATASGNLPPYKAIPYIIRAL